jgi:hypothetical protein
MGDTIDASAGGTVSPSLTDGSASESMLPFACPLPALPLPCPLPLSAIKPGLEFALGKSSSENRTLLERRLLFRRSCTSRDATEAASPPSLTSLSPVDMLDPSDASDEMEDRKIGRGGLI